MAVAPLSYGDKLARKFLPQLQGPNQEQQHDEKILTFQRLRRYDIARIQHDLIKLQHTIMANGGNEEDRVKLSSLLQDHGIVFVLRKRKKSTASNQVSIRHQKFGLSIPESQSVVAQFSICHGYQTGLPRSDMW